jgi:hypothetical protein
MTAHPNIAGLECKAIFDARGLPRVRVPARTVKVPVAKATDLDDLLRAMNALADQIKAAARAR